MNRCLTLFGYNMGQIAPRQPLPLRFHWPSATIAATLGSCFACVVLLAGTVHALDPNKRVTQYMHTAWRTQDGSSASRHVSHCANLGRFPLVLISSRRHVQVRWGSVSALAFAGRVPIDKINEYLCRPRWWAMGTRITRDRSTERWGCHFALRLGRNDVSKFSEDPDGSLWVAQEDNRCAPLPCY